MIFPEIIVFISSFIILSFAGSLLVRSLTRISKLFGISEYLIAFLLMSVATSIPELFIGLSSVIQEIPGLSLGNILGTNLFTITLIVGVIAIASNGIRIESKISRRNFFIIFFIAFLPILLGTDGVISRGDGVLLLVAFIIYVHRLISEKEYFTKRMNDAKSEPIGILESLKNFKKFFIGIVLLIASSYAIVWSSKAIVVYMGLSSLTFGIIFIAIGTSLPELMFGIKASRMKHPAMMLGNSLGSIAFNASFIIGITSVLNPIKTNFDDGMFIVSLFLFISFLLFNFFSYSQSSISRKEGIMLLLLYLIFLVFEIL